MRIPESKRVMAPANLRAQADNPAYRSLVLTWLDERYTLRYSGGLVPDLHHILAKVGCVRLWELTGKGCTSAAAGISCARGRISPLRAPALLLLPKQGGGVFCNPTSPAAPAKLRCLYETFPLALLTEAAGGASHDGAGSGALLLCRPACCACSQQALQAVPPRTPHSPASLPNCSAGQHAAGPRPAERPVPGLVGRGGALPAGHGRCAAVTGSGHLPLRAALPSPLCWQLL